MKNKLGLLLSAVMVFNLAIPSVLAWENPLSKYNLYEDTHANQVSDERENVMADYYQQSVGKKLSANTNYRESNDTDYNNYYNRASSRSENKSRRRNEVLRESSRKVFSDPSEVPAWLEGPSFYAEPTLESIIEKYRRSDFAGCLQECTSYVRKNPYDTLGFYYLAMCYTKVSDKDNAVKAYERVIELNANPMIVKYATNGRNCVMGNSDEACYQDVNVPELLRPYADLADYQLTPIDPQTLVQRNLNALKYQLTSTPEVQTKNENGENKGNLTLPFGDQKDDALDAFINAPYGNGLSPELNKEYKQLQLKKIQETINQGDGSDKNIHENLDTVKKFDKQKSDSGEMLLAYDMEAITKDPEYIRQKQEFEQVSRLFGSENAENKSDITDIIPYMKDNENISPEVIQTLMMQSMMGNISL